MAETPPAGSTVDYYAYQQLYQRYGQYFPTSAPIDACIKQYPPDIIIRGGQYYSTGQYANLTNCVLIKALSYSTTTVIGAINQQQKQITEQVNGIADEVSLNLASFGTAIGEVIDGVGQDIAASQYALLEDSYIFTDTIRQFFVGAAQSFVGAVDQAVESIKGTLQLIQVQTTNDVESLTLTIRDIILAQTAAQTELLGRFSETQSDTAEVLTQILDLLSGYLGAGNKANAGLQLADIVLELGKLTASDEAQIEHDVKRPIDYMRAAALGGIPLSDLVQGLLGEVVPFNKIASFILSAVATPLILKDAASAAMIPFLNKLAQDNAYESRFQLLGSNEVIAAYRHGYIDEDFLRTELGRAGIPEFSQNVLDQLYDKDIPPAELISWWLRGIITQDEFDSLMDAQGYPIEIANRIKQAAFFIPSPGDLITIAVREGFSPDIAQTFGQFDDFPEEFAKYAAQQGISEEWAKRFWAAHWSLPSITQAFEMFHRQVISRDELELLLKAQDVMPFWRDRLTAISYNPLTRVDVRRMHKLGIFDDDRVYKSYLDVGYSPEDAGYLTEFTVKYNEETPDLGAARDLARTQIVGLYSNRIIARDTALSLLGSLGYLPDDSALILDLEDVARETEQRKASIDLIKARAKAGVVTFEEAQAQLVALNVTQTELTAALADITSAQSQHTTIPSLSDLKAMHKARLLSDADFMTWLGRLGYSQFWQERYLLLNKETGNG